MTRTDTIAHAVLAATAIAALCVAVARGITAPVPAPVVELEKVVVTAQRDHAAQAVELPAVTVTACRTTVQQLQAERPRAEQVATSARIRPA